MRRDEIMRSLGLVLKRVLALGNLVTLGEHRIIEEHCTEGTVQFKARIMQLVRLMDVHTHTAYVNIAVKGAAGRAREGGLCQMFKLTTLANPEQTLRYPCFRRQAMQSSLFCAVASACPYLYDALIA